MLSGKSLRVIRDLGSLRNLLTIDVEDYYMVSAFSKVVGLREWDSYPSRVEVNTLRILDILDQHDTKATFFILGYVARKYPELVRNIFRAGHEISCHGNLHRLVYEMSPEQFREDAREAKAILEDLIGERVLGYRAPSYSITEESLWAIDILIEEGFSYDSSIFPVHHDRYGIPKFSRFPVRIVRHAGKEIVEIPLSTVCVFGRNIPVAGGGYFRIYPMSVTEWAIRRLNEVERERAVVYLHPWEIDPAQPRIKAAFFSRFRHYTNLEKTEGRVRKILGEFQFEPMREILSTIAIENTICSSITDSSQVDL